MALAVVRAAFAVVSAAFAVVIAALVADIGSSFLRIEKARRSEPGVTETTGINLELSEVKRISLSTPPIIRISG